ncbi:unnamed protein product [Chironomus riparius]|uniref:ABC transporter domain-containing protein n=1 Tax=Chironomus riparius TaxID=315576 RepID=A0A9N9SBF7_9DIPT|nr:unnamed protein product [Chironomus riparius]
MKKSSNWEVFKLLMWKNYLLQIRKPWSTLFEFIMPFFCCLLLIYLRSQIQSKVYSNSIKFSPLSPDNYSLFINFINHSENSNFNIFSNDSINKLKNHFKIVPEVLYSPQNEIIDEILSQVEDEILLLGAKITAVNNSNELELKMMAANCLVGIEFPDEYMNLKSVPSVLNYNIRLPGEHRSAKTLDIINDNWQTKHRFTLFPLTSHRTNKSDDGSPVRYYDEGFLLVQSLIFEGFMKSINKSSIGNTPRIYIQKFPYPKGIEEKFIPSLKLILPMLITFCFIYPSINIVKYIVVEKETKLKKIMRIMGVSSNLHCFTWFVKSFIYYFLITLLVLTLLTVNWNGNGTSVLAKSSISVLYVFVMIYCIVAIFFAFMISSLFQKSSIATAVAAFLWILQITPYVANSEDNAYEEVSKVKKVIMSLLQNYAMSIGMRIIATKEMHEGVQWNNLFQKFNDNISFGEIMIMMIACGVWKIFVIIGIKYIRNLIKLKKSKETECAAEIDANKSEANKMFLKIQNLTKFYPNSSKPAVKNLNLSLHQDQITILLGINGAGKSTTMAMLCGEIKPTSGTVFIEGNNSLKSGKIRHKSTGISFQENVLFNNLTVYEHLLLFGRLKENSKTEAEKEAQKFMTILNLHANDFACNLSGGMKRKLCLAIALCADSKFVILDEITSGVDPTSRRELWNFLQSVKKNRSIFMSTHYMLEAEVVADKIAILCEGELKAYGTPFELKQKFAKTCKLTCVKQVSCDSQIVTDFVQQSIPNVKVACENGMEICYKFECDEVSKIHNVLENLEDNIKNLHLESFGISSSSMDDVLEKVDDILDDQQLNHCKLIQNQNNNRKVNELAQSYKMCQTSNDSKCLFFKHLKALMIKRIIVTRKNFKLYFLQIFLPVLFVFFDIYFGYDASIIVKTQPQLELSIQTYTDSRTFIKLGDNVEKNTSLHDIYESYKLMINNFKDKNIELEEIDGLMENTFLRKSKTNLDLNYRNLFGVSIHKENVTAWYNNQPYHTLPITLNLIHNAILKASFGNKFGLNVGNKPLPYRNETRAANLAFVHSRVNLQLYLIISFALSVSYAIFVIAVVKERIGKSKNMQITVGIHPVTYWLSIFIWDVLVVLIIAITTSLAVAGTFSNYETIDSLNIRLENFLKIFLMLIICGISVLPITYASNFLFASPSSGFIKLVLIYIILGSTVFTIKNVFKESLKNLPAIEFLLGKTFLPVPHYNFCDVMKKFVEIDNAKEFCNVQCKYFDICDEDEQCKIANQCCDTNYFTWTSKGVLWSITRYIVVILIGFYTLFLVESKATLSIFRKFKKFVSRIPIKFLNRSNTRKCSIELNSNTFNIDPDVEIEKRMVQNFSEDDFKNYNLVLKNLSKNFHSKQAVKQICVAVKPGECFGLLGANGAGKTTTFSMLTGDVSVSSGDIFIQGLNLKTNLKRIHKIIGYCGQFDAHIDELTGRETLTFYAECRGINKRDIQNCIMQLATDFDFVSHLDKQVRFFSGGNKRKLSTAIALIGDPQIIFLDEPTSFMDPLVKKKFWNQIAKLRDSGKAIILSSHSMDEVEVLCTRIGIMMNGDLKCLGSPQYLKNKFGKTIVVTLKLKKIEVNVAAKCEVKRFIDQELPGAILKEEFHDMLIYHLTSKSFKWSKIFKTIEIGKEKLKVIDDFDVNQSNMIQVFLQVTSESQSF